MGHLDRQEEPFIVMKKRKRRGWLSGIFHSGNGGAEKGGDFPKELGKERGIRMRSL